MHSGAQAQQIQKGAQLPVALLCCKAGISKRCTPVMLHSIATGSRGLGWLPGRQSHRVQNCWLCRQHMHQALWLPTTMAVFSSRATAAV